MRNDRHQRGEGKIGCIITVLVISIVGAAAFQAVPVLYSNNEFSNSVENLAGRAAIIPLPTIEAQIRQKAQELGITEALAPGAIVLNKIQGGQFGTCTVRVRYTRKIDFYGVFTYPLETNLDKSISIVDAR